MNKFITMMLALVVMLFAVDSFAWDPPTSPAPASWISDPSGVLSTEAHARLDAKLKVINQSSANEVAALILPTLDGQDIADVGDKTAKAWGVGKKNLDNGVLVVLAMKEHKSRISTGKGVEGDLPDLKANDILQNARPYLRKGDVEGALGFIFDSSSQSIANHKADVAAGHTTSTTTTSNNGAACSVSNVGSSSDDSGLTLLLVLVALGFGTWLIVRSSRRKRSRLLQEQEEALQKMEAERVKRVRQAVDTSRSPAMVKRAEQTKQAPVIVTQVVPRHTTPADRPTIHLSGPSQGTTNVVAVAATAVAAEEEIRAAQEQSRRHAEEARRKRVQEEDDRRRRQQEEDDRRSSSYSSDSSSSSSSSDSGSSWGGGGSDSGGFGGGDFGGGGSSGDW